MPDAREKVSLLLKEVKDLLTASVATDQLLKYGVEGGLLTNASYYSGELAEASAAIASSCTRRASEAVQLVSDLKIKDEQKTRTNLVRSRNQSRTKMMKTLGRNMFERVGL